jgi:phage tail sheath protein FI
MFGSRLGRNASSNAVIHGDNYTRMTNYIAATLNRALGMFVGQLQSRRPTDKTRAAVKAQADSFFQALLDQGMIDDFQNICDLTNNPVSRIALGYLQLDCQVVYLAVVEYFIVNLQGGQSVIINRLSTQPTSTFAATPNSSVISAA